MSSLHSPIVISRNPSKGGGHDSEGEGLPHVAYKRSSRASVILWLANRIPRLMRTFHFDSGPDLTMTVLGSDL